jgi:hypothetical protein
MGQSRMDIIPETLATFGMLETRAKTKKNNTAQKTKKMSNMDPTKIRG